MLKIAIVSFREFLEIALLLSVIMAVTKKVKNSRIYIIAGAMIGVIIASLFAFATKAVSISFGGLGDEIFDSCVIILTVAVISWTIVWMQGYKTKIKKDLDDLSEKINDNLSNRFMLISVVASTVLREGTEIILLIYSISSTETVDINDYLLGIGIGALTGIILSMIIYWGLIKFAVRYIFKISSVLLLLIAAGLSSEAAGILTSSGVVTFLSDQLWDSSWLIEDRSISGRLLNVITGYSAKPNQLQVLSYISTILLLFILSKIKSAISNKNALNND